MINVNKYKLTELGEGYKLYADYAAQLLKKIPQQYQELAKNGGVALTEFLGEANQEVVEAINNYREWAQKASDVRTQQQQVKKDTKAETKTVNPKTKKSKKRKPEEEEESGRKSKKSKSSKDSIEDQDQAKKVKKSKSKSKKKE